MRCVSTRTQVEALQETVEGLGHSDGVLLQLTEEKAALQLQLRDAQVRRAAAATPRLGRLRGCNMANDSAGLGYGFLFTAKSDGEGELGLALNDLVVQATAAAAQASLADQAAYVLELEHACQSLRQQLDASLSQHAAAHAAVEAAADRLQQLADTREGLEQQLQQTREELAAAQQAAAAREGEHTSEAAQQQEARERLAAQLAEAEAERNRLAAEAQQFMSHNAELQEAMQVWLLAVKGVWECGNALHAAAADGQPRVQKIHVPLLHTLAAP